MRTVSALATALVLVLSAGCSTVLEGEPSATKAQAAATKTEPRPPTPTATLADLSTTAVRECNPVVIAEDLSRPQDQVLLGECLGDWAMMDNGGQYGDTTYLVRRVSGRWGTYTAFPATICRADAVSDGVPEQWLSSFHSCATREAPVSVDLGLSTPISSPACDGSGVVILHSAVDPDNYARDVQRALDANPGARYLRTDRSCSSLSPADAQGNPIYAVYLAAGPDRSDICRELGRSPAGSYAKVMDTTTDPTQATIAC